MTQTTPAHYKIWPPGMPKELEIGDDTLWDNLHNTVVSNSNEIAIEFVGSTYTWKNVEEQALHLAGALQSIGVKAGDRVILFAQNCPQFAIAFHAIIRCGAVVVPLNPMNKAAELTYAISNSEAKIAISAIELVGEFDLANKQLNDNEQLQHLIAFSTADSLTEPEKVPDAWRSWLCAKHQLPTLTGGSVHNWTSLIENQQLPSDIALNADDLALLMYTSGTTGHPKACMHSHRTIMANVITVKIWQSMKKGDASLVVTPMFHITGLVGGLLGGIHAGIKLVLMPRWDRRVALNAISSEKVTHWINIPTMVIDLLAEPEIERFDLSSLRFIGGGGAAMPGPVAQKLKDLFGLDYIEAYGLTETAAPSHQNPPNAPRLQCLGIPSTNTHACILNTETMQEASVGETGEILVRGPQVFLGYWKNPEATSDTFIDLNGYKWLRTGDLGKVDEDGYYYIADRLKRMINASGFKIWPAEVENLLHGHPAIQEVCIISKTDPYRGQTAKAFIVLRESEKNKTSAEDIIAWSRDKMAVYKVPREIEFVDTLPKGATGKILWKVLQAEQDKLDEEAKGSAT